MENYVRENAMTELKDSFLKYLEINNKRNNNYFRKKFKRGCAKFFHYNPVFHNYAGRKIISREDTNRIIGEMIESSKPFVVSRFGNTELNFVAFYHMRHKFGFSDDYPVFNSIESKMDFYQNAERQFSDALENGGGFFPVTDESSKKFVDSMMDVMQDIDVLGTWEIYMEEYYIENFMKKCILSNLYYLEPWFSKNPWSAKLKGKKVLVIHPFEESIIKQYKKKDKLFQNKNILPEFELHTLRAAQTIAGNRDERFADWFEALDYMYEEAMKIDFDIAILGCGAYGMPLAVKLKRAGRQAVHLGGATQLLFGIKGARWEAYNYPTKAAKLFNDYWIRPSETERVKGRETVEGGCYW